MREVQYLQLQCLDRDNEIGDLTKYEYLKVSYCRPDLGIDGGEQLGKLTPHGRAPGTRPSSKGPVTRSLLLHMTTSEDEHVIFSMPPRYMNTTQPDPTLPLTPIHCSPCPLLHPALLLLHPPNRYYPHPRPPASL
jgi:hypothetical protein